MPTKKQAARHEGTAPPYFFDSGIAPGCGGILPLLCVILLVLVIPGGGVTLACMLYWDWSRPVAVLLLGWAALDTFGASGALLSGRGRVIPWLKGCWWFRLTKEYFGYRVIQEVELPGQQYFFGAHPHGIMGTGPWLMFMFDSCGFCSRNQLEVRSATITANFLVPFLRDFFLALGLVDARKEVLRSALQRGHSVMVVVGGAAEALDTRPHTIMDLTLSLKRRRGFVRLALQAGTPLVPVLTFGEGGLYSSVVDNERGSWVRAIQDFLLKRLKFAPVLIYGRWGTIIPFPKPLVTVVGPPVPLPPGYGTCKNEVEPKVVGECEDNRVSKKAGASKEKAGEEGEKKTLAGSTKQRNCGDLDGTTSTTGAGAGAGAGGEEAAIEAYHTAYVKALTALYERHRASLDPDNVNGLRVVA